jgi:hypothetical protein
MPPLPSHVQLVPLGERGREADQFVHSAFVEGAAVTNISPGSGPRTAS